MALQPGKVESITALAQGVTRPLVTLTLVITFCYGFIAEIVKTDMFTQIVTVAVAFWFAQRSEDKRKDDGATATAPPTGGTATATVTTAKKTKGEALP